MTGWTNSRDREAQSQLMAALNSDPEFQTKAHEGRWKERQVPVRREIKADGRHHLGRAAEHRCLSELLLRGADPHLAIVDRGVDIRLADGTGIQVKAANPSKSGAYNWKLVQYRYNKGEKLDQVLPPIRADFFALWAVDIDRWYIVPADAVEGRAVLWRSKTKPSFVDEFENRWDLLVEESP